MTKVNFMKKKLDFLGFLGYCIGMKLRKGDIVLDRFDGVFIILDLLPKADLAKVRRWGSSQILHLVTGDFGDSRGLRKIAL